MSVGRDEEWREFYTQAGFRHGFALGAKTVRSATGPYLSAEQTAKLDAWLEKKVHEWMRQVLSEEEPPTPPKL